MLSHPDLYTPWPVNIAEQFQDSHEGKRKFETLKLHNNMISKSIAQYLSGGILRFEARGKKKGD